MRFVAFGHVRVLIDADEVPISRSRERQVLACLLASRGVPIGAQRLATDVWGADAASSTLGLLQVAISRLRSLLEPGRSRGANGLIVSTPSGYLLDAAAATVDLWSFEDGAARLLAQREPDAAECAALSARWQPPYAGIDVEGPRRHADRLTDLYADLRLAHAKALLRGGRWAEAARLLRAMAEEYYFREPVWCLLALAQYRDGRQADALATLRHLRLTMAEELGVHPTLATESVEEAILRHDDEALRSYLAEPSAVLLAPGGRARREPLLVGRDAQLAQGTEALDACLADRGARALLVEGEAGSGKTAYLDALARLAVERGFRVARGQNHPGRLAPPLWPWAEVVAPLNGEAPEHHGPPRRPATSAESVLTLLREAADATPLLVAIEDLHWADPATLQLLALVARTRIPAPILLVATRRTSVVPGPPLLECVAQLSRSGATHVRIDALPKEAVAELLGSRLGRHFAELDDAVANLTGGNPFFVLQYAALLAAGADPGHDAALDPSDPQLPEGIRDVLRERLHGLPASVASLLVAASVMDEIAPEALAQLVGRPLDEVLVDLDVAMAAGLLVEDGVNYAFAHAVARKCVSSELSAARRVRLHDRAGRLMRAARNLDRVVD